MLTRDMLLAGEDLAGSGTICAAPGGATLSPSTGWRRLHGLPSTSVPLAPRDVVTQVHDDDRASLLGLLEHGPGREGAELGYRVIAPDGTVRDLRLRARRHGDGWVAAARDVSAQRSTELALGAHGALLASLQDWVSFEISGRDLLGGLAQAAGYPVCVLWLEDECSSALGVRLTWCADPTADRFAPFVAATRAVTFGRGSGGPGRAWATGEPVVEADLAGALGPARRRPAQEAGLHSAVAVPAPGSSPAVVLAFYGSEQATPGAPLRQALTMIGLQLGGFLARRRAELAPRQLSDRELEVLRCAAEGLTVQQIASRLHVSGSTVKTHLEHIYGKFGVGDRAGAVAHGLRTGLIT